MLNALSDGPWTSFGSLVEGRANTFRWEVEVVHKAMQRAAHCTPVAHIG